MGWPEVAENVKNSPVITVAAVATSPARSGRVRRRLAVKFGWRDRSEVAHLPVWRMYSNSRRWSSSGPISHGSPMSKRSNSVPGLESSFLGFFEFKKCLGG